MENKPGQSKQPDADSTLFHGDETVPFLHNLTDVGLYSLGGLCAVSLLQLFQDDCQHDFRKKALEKILTYLGQPKQTNDSMVAIMEGDVMDNGDAFVDAILQESCVKETRQPLISNLIGMTISDGCYDARMRVLIKHVAWQLRVTWDEVEDIESDLAETLEYNTYVVSEEEAKEKAKKTRSRKFKRYALIGLATVGGGALIGLTGGLAAPLVAVGAGAVIGSAGAAALGSAAGVAIIGSLFGVAGAGLTGYKMKRRMGAIEEFAFEPLTLIGSKFDSARTVKQLHITIAVTGWLNDGMQDFRIPWSALAECKEQYSLRWESKYLYQLGEAFDYILQTGISVATTEALKYTILSGLITAIAWPAALISASGAIDNPWHVCTQRATETGKQLAEVLLAREQGNRPVTLIGFSMGSRVIFACLEELAKRKNSVGLVEDVILLGAPVSGDPKYWKPLTKVVAGKIVNGYARGDWLLKFLYRTASVTINVAGLGPVKWDNRRMHNIDLSDIIDGHFDYCKNLDIIMKAVGVRTKDELKTRSNKSSASASIHSFHATPTLVDHDCQTNDELECENLDKLKSMDFHAHDDISQRIPDRENDNGVHKKTSTEGGNQAQTQSVTSWDIKNPHDNKVGERSTSSTCGSLENLEFKSRDSTVKASLSDDKEVIIQSQDKHCETADDDSSHTGDNGIVVDGTQNENQKRPIIIASNKEQSKSRLSIDEISERRQMELKKNVHKVLDANAIRTTGTVRDIDDYNSKEASKVLKSEDNWKDRSTSDYLPLWESCYFTDSEEDEQTAD